MLTQAFIAADLQNYLDEYCYRFNRSFVKETIFENLLKRAISDKPYHIRPINN